MEDNLKNKEQEYLKNSENELETVEEYEEDEEECEEDFAEIAAEIDKTIDKIIEGEKFVKLITKDMLNGYQEKTIEIKTKIYDFLDEYDGYLYDRVINGILSFCFDNGMETFAKELMFDIVQMYQEDSIFSIFEGIAKVCCDKGKEDFAIEIISWFVKQYPKLAPEAIDGFVSICSFKNKDKRKIIFVQRLISRTLSGQSDFINRAYFTFSNRVIKSQDICDEEGISELEKLIRLFFDTYNEEPDNQKLIDLIKEGAMVLLFKYLEYTLFNLKEESFLKVDRSTAFEEQLLKLLQKCNIVDSSIKNFSDIHVDSLVNEWAIFFNNKIKYDEMNGGYSLQIVLYIIKDFAKGKTIEYLFNSEKLKNFYIAVLNINTVRNFEQFVKKSGKENDDFVMYVNTKKHAVVFVVEKGTAKLIDSSLALERFGVGPFLNHRYYQENDSCYLNAGAVFKIILDLADKKPLKDIFKYLSDSDRYGRQNVIVEVSKEIAKLYEFLGLAKNSQFSMENDDAYTDIAHSTLNPTTQAITKAGQQTTLSNEVIQPLKKMDVQQLKISRNLFAVKAGFLAKAFEELNYRVQCFDKDNNEAKNTEFFADGVFAETSMWLCSRIKVGKIIVTKEEQPIQQQEPQEQEFKKIVGCFDYSGVTSEMKLADLYESEMDDFNYRAAVRVKNQKKLTQQDVLNKEVPNFFGDNVQQLTERRTQQNDINSEKTI